MNVIPDLKGPFVYPYPQNFYILPNYNSRHFFSLRFVVFDGGHYIDPNYLNNPLPMVPPFLRPVPVPNSQNIEDKKQEQASESPAKPATPAAPNSQLPGTPVKDELEKSTDKPTSESKAPSEQTSTVFPGWKVPVLVNNGKMEEKQFPPNCHLVQVGPNLFSAVYVEPKALPNGSDSKEIKSVCRYSKGQKPTRHRRNFNQEVKQKILDLYHSYLTKESRLSVRSIAHHIFCRLSREM